VSLSCTHRWLVSAATMVASAYALDLVATAGGAALFASTLLDGAGEAQLLALLAGSYLVWAGGLRVSVGANWALLEATGASTNLPSVVAYDLARSRSRSRRLQRFAAGAGYIGTELAKEAPYYAAAFGAAALSEDVSSGDAMVFLAGTNLGAAAYEGALGFLVRLWLGSRAHRADTAAHSAI
jgi:uncharacterized membrane protein (UPF0136 family)